MKTIVISPDNTKGIEFIKKLKECSDKARERMMERNKPYHDFIKSGGTLKQWAELNNLEYIVPEKGYPYVRTK